MYNTSNARWRVLAEPMTIAALITWLAVFLAVYGADTTDPEAAIAGMLLPAAGPKGFGLAFIIDLLCGGLAGGGIGA